MKGRRVILFKQRPGADRKVGTARTQLEHGRSDWGLIEGPRGGRVYAKVRRKVLDDRFVCRADRSATIEGSHPRF